MPSGTVTPAGGGGGLGTVTSVSSANTAIAVATPTTTPALTLATLDVIAADGPAAANWSNNSKKITALTNGASAQDAAAFGQIPAALPPNGSASGDLGGSYPSPTVVTGAHLASATVPIASLADPTTGKVVGSAASAAAAVFPPGHEFDYVQVTSGVIALTATADGNSGGTAVIDGNAVTYDGSTRVRVEFFCPELIINPATVAHSCYINVYDGTTDLGRICQLRGDVVGSGQSAPAYGVLFLTPTAAAHTYHIRGWKDAAGDTAQVICGAGGASTLAPAYYRITLA